MTEKITTLVYLEISQDAPVHRAVEMLKEIQGISQIYFGRRLENNNIVDLAIDWATTSNLEHVNDLLTKGDIYNAILKPSLTGVPSVFSIQHSSGPGTFLDTVPNTVTEIATFYFLPDTTDAKLKDFEQSFVLLEKAILALPEQTTAAAGPVIGNLNNPDISLPVKAFIATVGWTSVDAHIAFTQTPEFAQSLGGLVPFLSGNADHHVQFQKA
ncbi:hypothetical protein DM02DRAFT_684881 [Periconia macrospinosa]|uniref:ABM domain-containing protein n=1 Tax=Periconia macrospinosa TaxID=97972 RepID=A0A2V1DHE2_9PLEO|nr:hypothetical protein DM02DRAFT_684881 [Periconia macrospinosa]